MPLQKLALRPGVNRENTSYANEGGYYASNKIRFRSGMPEKIGGWLSDEGSNSSTLKPTTGTLWGICRSMSNWLNLSGYNLLSLGTNLKYYIQSGKDGIFYDVTPFRNPTGTAVASNAFTTTAYTAPPSAYVTVVCNVPSHGAQTNDFVTISGVASNVNGIPFASLNGEFQVTYIGANTFSIQVYVTSSVTAGTTGAGTFTFQITTGNEVFTQNVGWGAGTWGGLTFGTATTAVSGGTLSSSNTTVTVTSTAGFAAAGSILIDQETISYTGKTTSPDTFTGCTRGVSGTGSGAATTHANGAAVVQSNTFTGWGDPAPAGQGIGEQLRLWSQSNFGEDLIFNLRGGSLYYWANAVIPNTFNRGQLLGPNANIVVKSGSTTTTLTADANCPSVANLVLVSDASRFVIAFGCNDAVAGSLTQDPLYIAWSDQESFITWTPAITNQAGSYRLSNGSQIITAVQTRQEILVLTDSAIYSMQYLGPPYVWGFQIMGSNISIAGPNVTATVNNVTYWMGTDKFYMYSGSVQTLPSTLREYVYTDINLDQSFQFMAGTNEGYNEVWWQYCSISGPNGTGTPANPNVLVDRYVIYNHLDNVWYYGDWNNYAGLNQGRTSWLDSSLRAYPMATIYGVAGGTSNATLVYHETGVDDATVNPPAPIVSSVTSSDFDIGDGHNFGFVWRLIPDLTFDGSSVNGPTAMFTVLPRANPGANYGPSNNPSVVSAQNYLNQRTYAVQQFTQQVYVRIRGRQMAFQVSSGLTGSATEGLGVQWQLGVPRIDIRPDGRR
jgi:hypothetical protein